MHIALHVLVGTLVMAYIFLKHAWPWFLGQNVLDPSCSFRNLNYGLHFYQNAFGFSCFFWNSSYGLHSYQNAPSFSCSFWNLNYDLHSH
jgi:hypothetical protein